MEDLFFKRIYVVFSHTPGRLGRAIRAVTGGKYNHVSLAFDPRLRRCCSFARIHENTPLYGGFVAESPLRFTRRGKPSRIMICALDIPRERYEALRRRIREIEGGGYIYNTFSALAAPLRLRVRARRAYTCVEFVADMLRIAGVAVPDGFVTVDLLAALLSSSAVYHGSSAPFCHSAGWGRDEFPVRRSGWYYFRRTTQNLAKLAAGVARRQVLKSRQRRLRYQAR